MVLDVYNFHDRIDQIDSALSWHEKKDTSFVVTYGIITAPNYRAKIFGNEDKIGVLEIFNVDFLHTVIYKCESFY